MLDTSGAALVAALEQGGCELVKPSLVELEHLVGRPLKGPVEQDWHAMALVRRGATRMVALTLGAEGAMLATPERCDPDAGHGCSHAQLSRCGRRVSGSDKSRPGARGDADGSLGVGHRRGSRYRRLCRHGKAAAGRRGGAIPGTVRRRALRRTWTAASSPPNNHPPRRLAASAA